MRLRNLMIKWLEKEREEALSTVRQCRKDKDVNGAIIAGAEASVLAKVIKMTKQICNIPIPTAKNKNFQVKTTTEGSYLTFFTQAENHHQALGNLIENSHDFASTIDRDMTIEITVIK